MQPVTDDERNEIAREFGKSGRASAFRDLRRWLDSMDPQGHAHTVLGCKECEKVFMRGFSEGRDPETEPPYDEENTRRIIFGPSDPPVPKTTSTRFYFPSVTARNGDSIVIIGNRAWIKRRGLLGKILWALGIRKKVPMSSEWEKDAR